MKRLKKSFLMVLMLFFLGGCWDSKDIQDILYITAMGIDYEDDQFVIYVQVASFSGVAKTENRQTSPTPVWVAKGSGNTLNEAMNNIYDKSNQSVYWAHINLIIFSEKLLNHGLDQVNDSLLRFNQIRETTWMYGTNESMEKIFLVTSLFGSSVQTSIFNPKDIYDLRSILAPIRAQRFYLEYHEPGMTIKLPKLIVKDEVWKGSNRAINSVKLGGSYLIKNKELKGVLLHEDLDGIRWLTRSTERTPLTVNAKDDQKIVLLIIRPNADITPIYRDGNTVFDLSVNIRAGILDMQADVPLEELEKEAEEEVKQEIMKTFKLSLEKKADIYNLEEIVYRSNLKRWKEEFADNFALTEDSIRNINVEVTIQQTGDFDYEYIN